jgi:biopolymer transport protein ExbD
LNSEDVGNVTDTTQLQDRLRQIFKDRQEQGTFREGTNEVEKTLFIKAPRSLKYGDVVKVIDGLKVAGAQPIGLQVDDLAE